MVLCNCCLKNQDVKNFNCGYRYICKKCFKSKKYLKLKMKNIY